MKRKADSNQAAVIDTEVDRPDIVLTLHQECTYNAAYAWVHQGFDTEILQEGLSAGESELCCFGDHWGVFRSEAAPRCLPRTEGVAGADTTVAGILSLGFEGTDSVRRIVIPGEGRHWLSVSWWFQMERTFFFV